MGRWFRLYREPPDTGGETAILDRNAPFRLQEPTNLPAVEEVALDGMSPVENVYGKMKLTHG